MVYENFIKALVYTQNRYENTVPFLLNNCDFCSVTQEPKIIKGNLRGTEAGTESALIETEGTRKIMET